MNDPFEIVGVRPELLERQVPEKENRWYQGVPWLSVIVLLIIVGGCLFCKWIMPKDPSYMDLKNYTVAPCREFLFGTDRDLRTAGSTGDQYADPYRTAGDDPCVSGIRKRVGKY